MCSESPTAFVLAHWRVHHGSIQNLSPGRDVPPGEVVQVTDLVTLPGDMRGGEYDLAIGIVGEISTEPTVRLAIKGRTADGWYPLGRLILH